MELDLSKWDDDDDHVVLDEPFEDRPVIDPDPVSWNPVGIGGIMIGHRSWRTKGLLKAEVRAVKDRAAIHEELPLDLAKFIAGFFSMHPDWEEIRGDGVVAIRVEPNEYPREKGKDRGRHFDVRSRGGINGYVQSSLVFDRLDWKHRTLLDRYPHISHACRWEVREQIDEYKTERFGGQREIPSDISGDSMPYDNCEVDHVAPHTFSSIMHGWLAKEGLTREAEKRLIASNAVIDTSRRTITDRDLAARWRAYHEAHAQLRCITIDEHKTTTSKERQRPVPGM